MIRKPPSIDAISVEKDETTSYIVLVKENSLASCSKKEVVCVESHKE
jgi:hypothetical protein